MNDFLNDVVKTVKKRPAIALKYDVSTALYASKKDEEPLQERTASGDFKLDIVAFLAAVLALRTAFSVLKHICKKKKSKKKKK